MPSKIDQVSFELGGLRSDVKKILTHLGEQDREREKIKGDVTEIKDALKPVIVDVAAMMPQFKKWEKMEQRALGYAAGALMVFSLVSVLIVDFIKGMFKFGGKA